MPSKLNIKNILDNIINFWHNKCMVVFGTAFASEVSMIFDSIVWRCTVFLIYIVYLLNKALYIIDAILHRFERTISISIVTLEALHRGA